MKRFALATLGYFVATMIVAVTWHLGLFHEKYVAMGALTRAAPIMPLGMFAVFAQGLVFAYIYPIYYRYRGGGAPLRVGIQCSLLLGVLVWTVMVFATAAKFAIEPVADFLVLGTFFQVIQYVAVGAVIGAIYGRSPLRSDGR